MNFVEKWVEEVQDPAVLADKVEHFCYRSGLLVIDDGVGCPCTPHKAFRADKAEDLAARAVTRTKETQHTLDDMVKRAASAEKELWHASKAVSDSKAQAAVNEKAAQAAEAAADQAKKDFQATKQSLAKANGRVADLEVRVKSVDELESKIAKALLALK